MFKKKIEEKTFSFLARWAAPPLLKTIRLTCSFEEINRENLDLFYPGENFILSFWHGHILPMAHYFLNSGFYTFVSPHRDGEYVARMMDGMGQNYLRTSLRDLSISALVRGLKLARQGETLAITPDGPVGPRFQVKPGIIGISERTKLPILPAAGLPTRAHFFSSWDRFCFPYPFAEIKMIFGDPLWPWEMEGDDEQRARVLENRMLKITRELAEDCSVPADYFTEAEASGEG